PTGAAGAAGHARRAAARVLRAVLRAAAAPPGGVPVLAARVARDGGGDVGAVRPGTVAVAPRTGDRHHIAAVPPRRPGIGRALSHAQRPRGRAPLCRCAQLHGWTRVPRWSGAL